MRTEQEIREWLEEIRNIKSTSIVSLFKKYGFNMALKLRGLSEIGIIILKWVLNEQEAE